MDSISRAIDIMRAHRDERLQVKDVAAALDMSPIAFSRLFAARMGIGPLAYMQRLRLDRAAGQLAADPSRSLVEVAFDAGFESQQTFTRAFSAVFGQPPGAYRKRSSMEDTKMQDQPAIALQFSAREIVTLPKRRFAGRRVTIDGINGLTPASAWEGLEFPVPGQARGMSYGICFGETATGTTDYVAGVELADGRPAPAGLELLELPEERYFVVRQLMPADGFGDHLSAGMERLWGALLPEAGVEPSGHPDIEGYPDDLIAGQTSGWLTYMVPIKPQ